MVGIPYLVVMFKQRLFPLTEIVAKNAFYGALIITWD